MKIETKAGKVRLPKIGEVFQWGEEVLMAIDGEDLDKSCIDTVLYAVNIETGRTCSFDDCGIDMNPIHFLQPVGGVLKLEPAI